VAGGGVLVEQAFVGGAVDDRCGFPIGGQRGGLVLGFNRLGDFLDMGAQRRAQAGVMQAVFLRLTGAFLGLCGIGHGVPESESCKSGALCGNCAHLSMQTGL
jgi:hypothetical protein